MAKAKAEAEAEAEAPLIRPLGTFSRMREKGRVMHFRVCRKELGAEAWSRSALIRPLGTFPQKRGLRSRKREKGCFGALLELWALGSG